MARPPAVSLAPGVWRIPLLGDFVNGFILRDEDGQVTLIDMGLKQSGPKVLAALASIGSGPGDVTRLMLTHAHPDHAGGAAHVTAVDVSSRAVLAARLQREMRANSYDARTGAVTLSPERARL